MKWAELGIGTRRAIVAAGVVAIGLALVAVARSGPRKEEASARSIEPKGPRVERSAPATAEPTRSEPTAAIAENSPIAGAPPGDALAPAHVLPPLGLDVEGGSRVDVDPWTGAAALLETDASLPLGLGIRRARSSLCEADGLFGRGWRSEVESTLHALPGGRMGMRRVDGLVLYLPVKDGLWASAIGEVEWLLRTAEGFEVRDPAGRLLRFGPDGRLVELLPGFKVERPARDRIALVGGVARLELGLDAAGRVARAKGPGVDLAYEYDADGELVRVRGTATRRYEHADGRLATVDGPRGRALGFTWDQDGRLERLDAPCRAPAWSQRYTFGAGLAEVATPGGAWSYTLEAPGGGAAWRVETPWGVDRITLDARGRIVATQAAGGPVERVERDRRGHVVAPGAAAEESSGVRRDARGALRELETPAGRRWTFERDATGAVVREDGPGGAVELERDAAGRRSLRRDATGERRAVRGPGGELDEVVADDGSTLSIERDDAGRVVRAGEGQDQVTLAWTDDGRLAFASTRDARLTYEHGAREERVETPWGAFTRGRDDEGRVERLETPAGTFRFEHDEAGRRTAVVYPNGVVSRLGRDAHGRVGSIDVHGPRGAVLGLKHERGAAGQVVTTTRDGATTRWGHDARGHLTSADGPTLVRTWTTDADGNRVASTDRGVKRAWTLDPRGRPLAAGDETFEHDAAGRLIGRRGPAGTAETRYGWDGLGRLVSVRSGARVVRFGYDGLSRVASRTGPEGTTRYVYERGQLLAEVGPGDRARLWVHGPRTDEPLAYRDVIDGEAGEWVFLHGDELGTTLAYSDAAGARVDAAALDPFGDVVTPPATTDRPVLFAGRLVDRETGLVDLRARFYAPDLGRFLDPDPVGVVGGPAPYVYADGRPLERRDPLGLWPWSSDDETAGDGTARPASAVTAAEALGKFICRASAKVCRFVSEACEANRAACRDMRLAMVRSGLVDRPGVDRPHFSEWTLVNLARDSVGGLALDLVGAQESAWSLGQAIYDFDDPRSGEVVEAAKEGYRQAALGYGDAMAAGQARYVRAVDTLTDDGHSGASAFANVAAIAVGETLVPVVPGWEAATGKDFVALTDRSEDRRLTTAERVQRGIEVGAEALGGAAALKATRAARAAAKTAGAAADAARAARAADLADDAARALDAARTARAADAADAAKAAKVPATPPPAANTPPTKGLAQALDPDAPRGPARPPTATPSPARAPPAAATPALEPDCVYVLGKNGKPVRIGNFLDEPDAVLDYLRKNPTAEVLVSNIEEAQKLKNALRHAPDLETRPRVFAGDDLDGARNNYGANGKPSGPSAAGRDRTPSADDTPPPPHGDGPDGRPTRPLREGDKLFKNRREAMHAAKDRAGIPRSAQPTRGWTVGNDPRRSGKNYVFDNNQTSHGRYYEFDTPRGKRVIAEHTADPQQGQPHFHAGMVDPEELDPMKVDFKKDPYAKIDGDHHYYYPE